MLERFKTTGIAAKLGALGASGAAFNAGVGGDRNENIIYRLTQGRYSTLKTAQSDTSTSCDIKVWVLTSGTNKFHAKGHRELEPIG
jgi:hypothetical protein